MESGVLTQKTILHVKFFGATIQYQYIKLNMSYLFSLTRVENGMHVEISEWRNRVKFSDFERWQTLLANELFQALAKWKCYLKVEVNQSTQY